MSRKPLPNPEHYTNAPPHQQPPPSRESATSPIAPPRRRISQLTVSSSVKTPTISSFSEYSEEETNDILRFYKLDSFDVKSWQVMDYSQTLSSHQQAQVVQKLNEPDDLADYSQDTSMLGALKDPLDIYRSINPRSKKSSVSFTENEMNINKPEFNSKKFLHLIHSDTPKQELIRGNEKLQHKMKEQSQSLRSLVKSNFDGFVGAKSTVDDVHEEMEEKGMVPDTGYGTDELKQYLEDAVNQANSVFGPIIQRTSKAEEIRNIMSHLERHRFYFDLPSILLSNMKQTKYDQIVKDYKKGKQLLKNVQQEDSNQNVLYLLMSKIWTKIEVNVEKVQQNLFVKLDDPWMEIESQAKYIELLLQLDAKKDPLLYYIHNQHIWLADYIHRAFSEHTTAVKDIVANRDNETKSSKDKSFNLIHFMQLLNTYGTNQFLNYLEISQESKIWSSTLEEVKLLLNVVTKTIPELHKFFLLLDRNEIRKQQFPGDMTWVQWHSMNNDVFEMLGLSIDRLFHPDKISQSSAQILGNIALPPLPVESTNSIVIGYYMHLISLELNSAIQETKPITLKNETRNFLYDHLIICRTDLIKMYCKTWLRDVKYLFEIDSEEFGGTGVTSELPVDFLYFQNFSLNCLASFYNAVPITLNPNPDEEEEDIFDIIAPTLVDTILVFLAELRTFAFKEVSPSNANQNNNDVNSQILTVDPEKGIRMLSALNYSVTVEKGLNQIFELFKQKFNFKKVANVSEIKQGFKKLKDELFDNYIRLKFTRIHRILERGIIKSDFKWGNDDVPSEIRPYVYDSLMCLVLVHAEITKISYDMLKKIMPHLSDLISVDLLELFGKLKQFGMQGALQATLEIGFIRNTLKPYTSQLSNTNYDKLIHWVQRKQYKSTSPALDSSNPKLQELGKLVAKSEKYTRGMFGCFNAEG